MFLTLLQRNNETFYHATYFTCDMPTSDQSCHASSSLENHHRQPSAICSGMPSPDPTNTKLTAGQTMPLVPNVGLVT